MPRRERWTNWAGDQRCAPAAIVRPRTRRELVAAVERAAAAGERVRVAGSGHSFTDIALTDGFMLDLSGLDRVLDVDGDAGLVRVEAGITLHALGAALDRHGLALENLGDIDRQSVGGAISTATHGTGARFPNLPAQIEAVELVLADGRVASCSASEDREAWLAARVGLGALGAIAAVTLRCVPAFTLRRLDAPRPLGETLAAFDELAAGADHFELYVLPHTDVALTRTSTRSDEPPRPRDRRAEWLREVLLENHAMDLLARAGRRVPALIPPLARLAAGRIGRSLKVDRSHRVFASRRLVRFTEMEYAIPRARGPEAVRRVLEVIERRDLDVSFPIELRVAPGDDAFLSTGHGRDTCYVAVHMYRGMLWEPYFRAVEAIMRDYAGRPHWGKRHFQSAETLAPLYPAWDRFQAVRARLDPEGRFANEYVERVLGPVSRPAPV